MTGRPLPAALKAQLDAIFAPMPAVLTAETMTSVHVNRLRATFTDATDPGGLYRYLCRVALGGRCVQTRGGIRGPTEAEVADAKRRLADVWNQRNGGKP